MPYVLVDVDGTIIDKKYNTTYKLLLDFFSEEKPRLWKIRSLILRTGCVIESQINEHWSKLAILFSQLYLSIVLFMINYDQLYSFAKKKLSEVNVDYELINYLKKLGNTHIVTATIEPVAELFSNLIGSDSYIATYLKTKNNRILYVKKRHLTNTKYYEIRKKGWFPYIYIVDNPEVEHIVSKNSKYTIKHICCEQTEKVINELKRLLDKSP